MSPSRTDSDPMQGSGWPIIVVTGANAGLGFGICQRLLFQLCQSTPSDISAALKSDDGDTRPQDLLTLPCEGLTLILACRNQERGNGAKSKLFSLLDAHVRELKQRPSYDGHAERFRKNLKIQVHCVNLAILTSVFHFCAEITENYSYISHLICNAGVAGFYAIDWFLVLKQFFADPPSIVVTPRFYRQSVGEMSIDSLGFVWQCNLFSHYVMIRMLQPLLMSANYPHDSRVIWTGSITAAPGYNEAEDWQLKKSAESYEAVKHQIELLATKLDRLSLKSVPNSSKRIRHLVADPGSVHTSIALEMTGPILDFIKLVLFYIFRLTGTSSVTIQPFKGAISAVYLALVPLYAMTLSQSSGDGRSAKTVKCCSEANRWGKERIGYREVKGWNEHEGAAQKLLNQCEELLQSILAERSSKKEVEFETASERM